MKALSCSFLCLLATILLPAILRADESLQSWLPERCEYHGQFEQTRLLQELPSPLISNGRFFFDCQAGVIWQTETPIFNTTIYTKDGVNFRFGREGSVSLLKGLVHGNMSSSLRSLMAGNVSSLSEKFIIAQGSTGETELELIPNRAAAKKHLQKVLLRRSGEGIEIDLVNSETTQTSISISEITEFQSSGSQVCQAIFTALPPICEGLYFPRKVMDAIQTDH